MSYQISYEISLKINFSVQHLLVVVISLIKLSIISFSKSNYQYPPLRSVVKAIATVNID